MPSNDRIEIETLANVGDGPAGKPLESAISVAPSSSEKFVMLIVIFVALGFARRIPDMLRLMFMFPWAVLLTKTTLVHDVFTVKFAAGTNVLMNVH